MEFPFGNPTGRSKFWNAPIFGMSLFSTLKSDWILAGICLDILERPWILAGICLDTCLDILERPFFDFGMSLDILERPFSDFGMSLDIFRGIAGLKFWDVPKFGTFQKLGYSKKGATLKNDTPLLKPDQTGEGTGYLFGVPGAGTGYRL